MIGISCMSDIAYRDRGGRPDSWESVVVTDCSFAMKSPMRGVVEELLRPRRVLIAERVDEGGKELGLINECARSLWSDGDIRVCKAACTRAWRA